MPNCISLTNSQTLLIRALICAFFLFSFGAAAQAATYFVSPSGNDGSAGTQSAPFKTIQNGINNAANGDTVKLEDGTYTGAGDVDLDTLGKNMTITSVDGSSKAIINCGGSSTGPVIHRAFYIHMGETNAVISGLTVENGYETDNGGGVFMTSASAATISSCVFSKNAAAYGGGIYIDSGCTAKVLSCTITLNTTTGGYSVGYSGGGGVCTKGSLTLSNSSFTGNSDTGNGYGGGAFASFGGTSTLSSCSFSKNSCSGGNGGAVLSDDGSSGSVSLNYCTFVNNSLTNGSGGAAACDGDGNLDASGCTFNGNSSDQDGGAFYADVQTNVNFNGCEFTNNSATDDAGGIACVGNPNYGMNTIGVENSSFTDNTASSGGGMLCYWCDATFTGCTFTANSATEGGAIQIYATQGSMKNCSIINNKATAGVGGGIYDEGAPYDDPFVFADCQIVDNSATGGNGGGMENAANAIAYIQFCDFYGNSAPSTGSTGGGSENDGTATLVDDILWGDSAPSSPEVGIATTGSPVTTVTYSDIENILFAGAGNIKSNPLFIHAPTNLHLEFGSPVRGKGTAISGIATDFDGKTRPNPPAIGAFEGVESVFGRFDFNGDGDDDLLWSNTSAGNVLVWDMDGPSVETFGATFTTVAPPWQVAAVADINADHHPDLLWWNSSTGQVLFWTMIGSAGTTVLSKGQTFASITDTAWHPVSMADFDLDGHPDILWENFSTGQLLVWYMDGSTVKTYGSAFATLPTGWHIAGTADFDLDGHPDLLLENAQTGQLLVCYLAGSKGTAIGKYGATFATDADLSWKVESLGDTDGDGHPDLTWHNTSTGQTLIWRMGGPVGTTVLNYGSTLASSPSAQWTITGVH